MISGTAFFLIGVLMVVFHRPVGIGFCRIGKWTWSRADTPFTRAMAKDMVKKAYDESKAPRIMLVMGMVFAAEGVLFWLFPAFVR